MNSAPVERIFSQGERILRPHRVRLGDERLSDLVYLKCNSLSIFVTSDENDIACCAIIIDCLQYDLNTTFKGPWIWHHTFVYGLVTLRVKTLGLAWTMCP